MSVERKLCFLQPEKALKIFKYHIVTLPRRYPQLYLSSLMLLARLFLSQHDMSYFTFESIGVAARINCSRCGEAMDNHQRKPRTGLCGHSICQLCFNAKYIYAKKTPADFDPPGPYYRCCAPTCDEPAFSLGTPTSSSLMIAISLLDQLKWAVNSHLIKIHDKYNAFDIMALQNELQVAKNEIQMQEGDFIKLNIEMEQAKNKMLKALIAKDEADCKIENQRNYILTLQKQLMGLPLDEVDPTPTDLSQEMASLEKLAKQKKRHYNTDTDSSLGSLDRVTKKTRVKKRSQGRKVSLETAPKKAPGESPEESQAPKFSYGLESSPSTTSIQSTQENEF